MTTEQLVEPSCIKNLPMTTEGPWLRKRQFALPIQQMSDFGIWCTGMEPHSALPVAMPMVFSDHCDQLPEGLRGIKLLGHTAVSAIPLPPIQTSSAALCEFDESLHAEMRVLHKHFQ